MHGGNIYRKLDVRKKDKVNQQFDRMTDNKVDRVCRDNKPTGRRRVRRLRKKMERLFILGKLNRLLI